MTLNKRGEEKSFLYGNSLRTCNESRKPSNQNIAQRYLANDSTICIKNSGMVCFSILQKKIIRTYLVPILLSFNTSKYPHDINILFQDV